MQGAFKAWEVGGVRWVGPTKSWISRKPRVVKPMVGALPEVSSYRDQGEDHVDHTGSDGGVGWLPYPRRLEDAG